MHTRTAASLRLNVLLLLPPLLLLATVFLVVAGVAVVVDGAAVAGGAPALTATASDVCVCVVSHETCLCPLGFFLEGG